MVTEYSPLEVEYFEQDPMVLGTLFPAMLEFQNGNLDEYEALIQQAFEMAIESKNGFAVFSILMIRAFAASTAEDWVSAITNLVTISSIAKDLNFRGCEAISELWKGTIPTAKEINADKKYFSKAAEIFERMGMPNMPDAVRNWDGKSPLPYWKP